MDSFFLKICRRLWVAGIPVYNSIAPGSSACYMFKSYTNDKDLKFTVTPMSGDPDLYIFPNGRSSIDPHGCPGEHCRAWGTAC